MASYVDSPYYFAFWMWWLLFFGALLLPGAYQMVFDYVDEETKPQANSLANLNYNIFGNLPAPLIYGTI